MTLYCPYDCDKGDSSLYRLRRFTSISGSWKTQLLLPKTQRPYIPKWATRGWVISERTEEEVQKVIKYLASSPRNYPPGWEINPETHWEAHEIVLVIAKDE